MFWYFVVLVLVGLLFLNRGLRQKVKLAQRAAPGLYASARTALQDVSLNRNPSLFDLGQEVEKLEKIAELPLGQFVFVISNGNAENSPKDWESLSKWQKDAAHFLIMSDKCNALEARYTQLFMDKRARSFFNAVRELDPRELREQTV